MVDKGCIGIAVLVVGILIFGGIVWAAEQVDVGHTRVVKAFGELTGEVLEPGLNWIVPIKESTTEYVTLERTYETSDNPEESNANYTDFPTNAQTTDGQQISVKYTVKFRLSPTTVLQVAENIGDMDAVVEIVVKANSRNLSRILAQKYTAEDLFSGSGIVTYQEDVKNQLNVKLAESGVVLVDFLVRKIEFDADYIQAIEKQQIAQENIETAQYEAQAAEFERDRQIKLAEAEAERKRLLADAEAYAISIKGQALRNNPLVIQFEFVSNLSNVEWGILPAENIQMLLPTTR
jgi:regulator of protease activity HflC (stomatin/prohibitin superfamily)